MKKYDFETIISKKGKGAYKWEQMYKENPNISDDIIPFSVADMEFKFAPEIVEELKDFLDKNVFGYSGMYDEYYEAVISWMQRKHNFKIEKEWIVTSSGVVSALYDCVKAFTNENDGVIIFTPVYYPFYNAIKDNKREIVECPFIEKKNTKDGSVNYEIDFEKFKKLAKNKENKLLILCSPHNPLGIVFTKEELEKIGEICVENDVIIVSDEIHFDLIMPNTQKHTVLQTISNEIAEITVTCTAPTKTFNLAGIGISNIIIKNKKLRDKFSITQGKSAAHTFFALNYRACEYAYNFSEEWLNQLLLVLDKNQKLVNKFFIDKFGKNYAPLIHGTYLQWINCSEIAEKLDKHNFDMFKFLKDEAQIFMSDGKTFGKNYENYVRLNLAVPTSVIENMLERLEKAIKRHYLDLIK